MTIFDISQELYHSNVYPGDPIPNFTQVSDMNDGALYNLTTLTMCVHNGTHIDAPKHFYKAGKSIDELDLSKCVGECSVITLHGTITDKELLPFLSTCKKRILIKGDIELTISAAKALNRNQVELIGVESQSVGALDTPMPVHLELLGHEVVLLEGLILTNVPDGDYFLSAAPIKLGGSDGAPCRAILIQF